MFSLYFSKNITYLLDGLLRIGQDFSVSFKIYYSWVLTNCFFVSDVILVMNLQIICDDYFNAK